MIKVIKPGQSEFITTCTKCGCVFSYTLVDLINNLSPGYVYCPHCHATCYHFPNIDCNYNTSVSNIEGDIK